MNRLSQIGLLSAIVLTTSPAFALVKVQTFDNPPQFGESPLVDPPNNVLQVPLPGEWGWNVDGACNTGFPDCSFLGIGDPPFPIYDSGGFITPVGTETPFTAFNRFIGAGGAANIGGAPLTSTSITTNVATGVLIYDETSWLDVSDATHVTMDVKGSFEGSGGISVIVTHNNDISTPNQGSPPDSKGWWSWAAAGSAVAVGANPGDVTEWTTILIPITRPQIRQNNNGSAEVGEAGAFGNWGPFGNHSSDQAMQDDWDLTFGHVNQIQVAGLPPDAQIDNLGFVLPDVGLAGDFDMDDDVDGADFLEWQRGFGTTFDADDLTDWQTNYGMSVPLTTLSTVPEPSTMILALFAGYGLLHVRRRF